tara:strand:- start:839 stop:1042 length:204 start_codon:yes stop_codon:yes gene_type:complete
MRRGVVVRDFRVFYVILGVLGAGGPFHFMVLNAAQAIWSNMEENNKLAETPKPEQKTTKIRKFTLMF